MAKVARMGFDPETIRRILENDPLKGASWTALYVRDLILLIQTETSKHDRATALMVLGFLHYRLLGLDPLERGLPTPKETCQWADEYVMREYERLQAANKRSAKK